MRHPGTLCAAVIASILCAGLRADLCTSVVLASAAGPEDYQVIVHPDNPAIEVERRFVRDAYLRKAIARDAGAALRPIDLAPQFAVRERFAHDVLQKAPQQLKSYWNQQIFSGK